MNPEQVEERRRQGQERWVDEWVAPRLFSGAKVLDIGCGGGWTLRKLREISDQRQLCLGLEGIDSDFASLNSKAGGQNIMIGDMHDLPLTWEDTWDFIVISHTLEHSHMPNVAVGEWRRVTRPGALALVVLPYPDVYRNNPQHVGRFIIGTSVEDEGRTVEKFFEFAGWEVLNKRFDDFREPEIWLEMKKAI
jgi:ubiquinone/menaquinone biosynthesis C-methylase UbiE